MEMNESLVDEIVLNKVENLFIRKEVGEKNSAVIAAVITAASKMAEFSKIVDGETTVEQLLDLYQKNDDIEVKSLVGMDMQYVENVIGYNQSNSLENYNDNKQEYDEIYNEISARAKIAEQTRKLA